MLSIPQENIELIDSPELGNFSRRLEARRLFRFIKAATTQEAVASRMIPLETFNQREFFGYRLSPITVRDESNHELIEDLYRWRVAANFDGDEKLSVEGTRSWLKTHLLEIEDRVLFLVHDEFGNRVGHLGLWFRSDSELELDNVIKGPGKFTRGVMSEATKALGRWVNEFLGIEHLHLRVRQDNLHAINFYQNVGFVRTVAEEINTKMVGASSELEVGCEVPYVSMFASTSNWLPNREELLTAGPSMGIFEQALVSESVRSGWNNHFSDFVTGFNRVFGEYIEADFVIPTDSCTSALHLALWTMGVGPGDEVIVPEITWVASAAAVRYVGATPVFADVNEETWCLDPNSVREKITTSTRGIVPVHLYGFVADLEEISSICEEYGLFMVQDAAPGIGTTINSKSVTAWGDISCFSFQGAKLLVSGEGGAFVTRKREIYERALKISQSGRRPGTFWIEQLGKKITMGNPTAALALAQVYGVERQIDRKRRIASWYREGLDSLQTVRFQKESSGTRSIHWMNSIYIGDSGADREELRSFLLSNGIDTRPVFSPISRYPIWGKDHSEGKIAALIGDNSINLPSGVHLSEAEVNRVCDAIRTFFR